MTGLIRGPAALAPYQSLALLSVTVMELSRDSGRPEAEISDGLAASLRPGA